MKRESIRSELVEKRYPRAQAHAIALSVLEQLRPFCIRAEIAGSLRRKKSFIRAIEIVIIPKPYSKEPLEDGLTNWINKWEKIRGDMKFGKTKYTERMLPEGIELDLFFATEKNWGYIFAIETGDANFNREVLTISWRQSGFNIKDGYLVKDGERYEVREEKDLFEITDTPYVEPEERYL